MSLIKRNIILIGCGLHYQDKYHDVLEKNGIVIVLLIDLESSKESILQFFKDKQIQPQHMLFLNESYRNYISLKDIISLTSRFDLKMVDGVILSTEPKVRKPFALWAAHRRFPIFMDKPVTAFIGENRLLEDFDEINEALDGLEAVISCERRANHGYLWLENYLRDFILKTKLPITSIDIQYAGGIFNLPHEYPLLENHPFKYGYGILLHSGYHYIDLLVRLLSLNKLNEDFSLIFQTMVSRPNDLIDLNYLSDNKTVFPNENYGETDLSLIGQLLKNEHVVTNFSVKLNGTSLSLRKNKQRDSPHRLPGKVRQEYVTIHLGHQCSIHIVSMPLKKIKPSEHPYEHFDMTILNSPNVPFEPLIKMDRKTLSSIYSELPEKVSMNGFARQFQLQQFLLGHQGQSHFESHRNTVHFIDSIYNRIKENKSLELLGNFF